MAYVTARDGTRIRYEAIGGGQPVLLLTGVFGALEDWHEAGFVEALASERRVLTMDLRGHGGSDKPRDAASYGWPINAQDVLAVLEATDAREVDIYGYSMGGHVVVAMLLGDTSRVRSFAASGTYVPPPGFEPPPEMLVERARMLRLEGLTEGVARRIFVTEDVPRRAMERALAGDAEAYAAEADGQAVMEHQALAETGPPTLFIAAEHDRLAVALCAGLPDRFAYVSYAQIDGAQHDSGLDPRVMLPVLRPFWNGVSN